MRAEDSTGQCFCEIPLLKDYSALHIFSGRRQMTLKKFSEKPVVLKCSKCSTIKEFSSDNFAREIRNRFGLSSVCLVCMSRRTKSRNDILKKEKKEVPNEITCSACNETKPATVEFFHRHSKSKTGFKLQCKPCRNAQTRKWNKLETTKERERKKMQSSPFLRIKRSVNCSIHQGIRAKGGCKQGSCWDYLGYTPKDLMEHLEKQFEDWMTWENYGSITEYENKRTWQIDHIHPHSKLPYETMECENFKKCWALGNLQPLDSRENIIKSNKIMECK